MTVDHANANGDGHAAEAESGGEPALARPCLQCQCVTHWHSIYDREPRCIMCDAPPSQSLVGSKMFAVEDPSSPSGYRWNEDPQWKVDRQQQEKHSRQEPPLPAGQMRFKEGDRVKAGDRENIGQVEAVEGQWYRVVFTNPETGNQKRKRFKDADLSPADGSPSTNGKHRKSNAEPLRERPLPNDQEAEHGVLGAGLLFPNDILPAIRELVSAEDFFDPAHQILFRTMTAMRAAGQGIDPVTLGARLRDEGQYEAVGGAARLAELCKAVPRVDHARFYANIVRELANRRTLIIAASEAIDSAYDGEAGRACVKLRETTGRIINGADAVRTLGRLREQCPELRPWIVQGLLRVGETMSIVAPPKVGKSWCAYGLAWSIAAGSLWAGKFRCIEGDVLLIDNELQAETLADRIPKVAYASKIDPDTFGHRFHVEALRGRLRGIDQLGPWLEQFAPGRFRVVILDSLYRALPEGCDENSNSDMTAVYNLIDSYAEKMGCAWVLVHHQSKGNQAGKSVTDVGAGAGAQSRAVDTHLVLRQHSEPGVFVLEAAVRSFAPVDPICIRWRFPAWELAEEFDPAHLKRPAGGPKAAAERPTAFSAAMDAVRSVLAKGPHTANGLKTATRKSGSTINEALEALAEAGEVEECDVETARGTFPGYRLSATPDNPGLSGVESEVVRPRTDFAPIGGESSPVSGHRTLGDF